MQLPKNTRDALDQQHQYVQQAQQQYGQPPQQYGQPQQHQQGQGDASAAIATQCFMVSNMFDINEETTPDWDLEIRDDIIDELATHGGLVHIYVDKLSKTGNVYLKSPSAAAAQSAVAALHGRWFAGMRLTLVFIAECGLFRSNDHGKLRTGRQLPQPLPGIREHHHAAFFSSSLNRFSFVHPYSICLTDVFESLPTRSARAFRPDLVVSLFLFCMRGNESIRTTANRLMTSISEVLVAGNFIALVQCCAKQELYEWVTPDRGSLWIL